MPGLVYEAEILMCGQVCWIMLVLMIFINQAGEDLLSICDLDQLSLMNTWFKKRANLFGTWTHPATKQCSMIDFVMLLSAQR